MKSISTTSAQSSFSMRCSQAKTRQARFQPWKKSTTCPTLLCPISWIGTIVALSASESIQFRTWSGRANLTITSQVSCINCTKSIEASSTILNCFLIGNATFHALQTTDGHTWFRSTCNTMPKIMINLRHITLQDCSISSSKSYSMAAVKETMLKFRIASGLLNYISRK